MSRQTTPLKRSNILLIIVGVIIGLLFYLAIDARKNMVITRKYSFLSRAEITAIQNILAQYHQDTGYYPSTSEGLKALAEKPTSLSGAKWNGPYVHKKQKFVDLWNKALHYECPGIHNPDAYDVWSYGADGKKGGTGICADIGNW